MKTILDLWELYEQASENTQAILGSINVIKECDWSEGLYNNLAKLHLQWLNALEISGPLENETLNMLSGTYYQLPNGDIITENNGDLKRITEYSEKPYRTQGN